MSRFSLESIAIVHIFTIGMFAMVMLGALQQMLPVLAGVSLPKAAGVATVSHIALAVGVLFMAAGLLQANKVFGIIAAAGLGIGFTVLLAAIAIAMKKVTFFNPTVKAMVVVLGVATLIALLGLHLLGGHVSGNISAAQITLSDIHSVWAVFGFAGILIIGVSFQVIPMFYVTPQFSAKVTAFMVPLILFGLMSWLILNVLMPGSAWIGKGLIAILFLLFSAMIVKKMQERRRPIADVTVWYWKLGAFLLAAGILLWMVDEGLATDYTSAVAVLIGGFLLSIIMGMLYKIVPFLVWFHLTGDGYMTVPTMNELIDKKTAQFQFILFVLTVTLFLIGFWIPFLVKIGAVSFFISMGLLEYNLLGALKTYKTIKKDPPEFSWTQPQ